MRREPEIQPEGFRDLRKHLLEARGMRCPFFEEVLVAFCRAFPVKKMVPSGRLQADCLCTREEFDDCPLFREVMARVEGAKLAASETVPPPAGNVGRPSD